MCVRKFVYEGRTVSKDEVASILGVHVSTMRRILKDIEYGTDITEIVNSKVLAKWYFRGSLMSATKIGELLEINPRIIRKCIASAPARTDVTDIVSKCSAVKRERYMYKGTLMSFREIAHKSGHAQETVSRVIHKAKLKPSDDVTSVVDNIKCVASMHFVVKGKYLTTQSIARMYGVSRSAVTSIASRCAIKDGGEIPETLLLNSSKHGRYLVNGKFAKLTDISREYGIKRATLYRRIYDSGRKTGEEISDLLSVNGVVVGGTKWSLSKLMTFLHLSRFTSDMVNTLDDYNYTDRLKLGFDKSSRSTWIIDDLWEYECPVCHKKLLLTTDEIIKHEHGSVCEEAVII